MSFLPVGARGHGLVLLTVGPPAVTAGCPGQAGPGPGGGWGCWEASGPLSTCVLDHGPSPPQTTEAQVGRPPGAGFLPVSACPVGDLVSIPVLRSLLSLYHLFSPCVSVYALSAFSVSPLFLSLPFLCRLQLSPSFLLCSAHLSSHFCFLSSASSSPSFPSPCHLLPIRQILHVSKEKKRGKKIKTQKSQNKNKSRVCCQVPRPPGGLCVRPRGPQPARLPPRLSAVCPARLPACPSCR